MQARFLSHLFLASVAVLTTASVSHAQSMSADDLTSAMHQSNSLISRDLGSLRARCANQNERKLLLEEIIKKNQPQLSVFTAMKVQLTEDLRLKDADLRMKRVALATLRAEIAVIEDSIKNAKTSTATRVETIRAEIAVAQKVAAKATGDIDRLDDNFEKWKQEGSNEFTLYRALHKDENNKWLDAAKRVALTPAEQSALDTLTAYDTTRGDLNEIKLDNEALVTQKTQAIVDLQAGKRANIEVLRTQLTERKSAVGAAFTAKLAITNLVKSTRASLRNVNARIATLSNIVVPSISPICAVISEISTPQN